MKRPSYEMQKIKLADCKPHADAEAYSASTEDRAALSNSIGEAGILSPIAVVPDEDGRGWYVIDGIGRMNALIAAGETETEAQVFDLGDLSVAEFVVCKNAMMRKVTTGTRVMAYLKCHEREVFSFQPKRGAVSRETLPDKGWSAKEIAERIGVSKNDVLAGIELLKEVSGEAESVQQQGKYVQLDLFETMDSVMHGETPIRRWKAAASGKVSKVGGKAAADYVGIGARTMVSLIGGGRAGGFQGGAGGPVRRLAGDGSPHQGQEAVGQQAYNSKDEHGKGCGEIGEGRRGAAARGGGRDAGRRAAGGGGERDHLPPLGGEVRRGRRCGALGRAEERAAAGGEARR